MMVMIGLFLQLINLMLWGTAIYMCVYFGGLLIWGAYELAIICLSEAFKLIKTIVCFIGHFFYTIIFKKPLS